jgi:hypothetical protein
LQIGFNVEELKYKSMSMTVWDVGGQTKVIAVLWWRVELIRMLNGVDPTSVASLLPEHGCADLCGGL